MSAAVNGLLAVVLGAFGAHVLEGMLGAESLDVYRTAVQYHMFHVTGFVAVALCAARADGPLVCWAGRLFLAGIVLFSGSLYLLAVTGVSALGAFTPFGGLAFIGGWALLIAALLRREERRDG